MEAPQLSIDDLDCPVCREIMESPIRTSALSHNICDNCFNYVSVCPICRGEIIKDINHALEKYGQSLIYKCTNKLEGCDFQAPLEDIKKHNEFCQYTVSECPLGVLDDCRWSGKIQEIMNHCFSKHPNNTFSATTQTLLCTDFFEVEDVHVIMLKRYHIMLEAHGKLFKIIWGLNCLTGFTLWRVVYCGPSEDAVQYRFSIEFQSPLCLQDKLRVERNCQLMVMKSTACSTMYVPITRRKLVNYCVGTHLYYTIGIHKKSEGHAGTCNNRTSNVYILEPEGRINQF